jgi:hypothetical protein
MQQDPVPPKQHNTEHLKQLCQQVLSGRLVPVCGGEDVWKGCRRINIVQIPYTHVYRWKNETLETILGMRGEGIKNDGGGEFKYDIFDIL